MNNRPKGMSQLDYLWTYFGNYKVSDNISDTPNEFNIVSEKALMEYLDKYSGGIVKLQLFEKENDPTKLELIGISSSGETLTIVDLDKEDNLTNVKLIFSTQVEIDNKVCENIDEPLLVFTMKSGKSYYINLSQFAYIGGETKSIKTTIVNNKIYAHIKIDDTLETSVVDVQTTDSGLRIDLLLKDQSNDQLRLVKTTDGLETKYTWDDGNNILFQCMTFNEYQALGNYIPGKIYFITDAMFIYLNGSRYGSTLSVVDTSSVQVVYTENGIGLKVKISSEEGNLLSEQIDGLSVKLYWEELE